MANPKLFHAHPRKAAKLRKMGVPASLAEVLVQDSLSTDEVVSAAGYLFWPTASGTSRPVPRCESEAQKAAVYRLANALMTLANNV
jgi:hypothetical protein